MRFTLNDRPTEIDAHPMRRLLDVLREDCGLSGTKEGCGEGECGACTVLVNGDPVCSCLVPLAQVESAEVLTIEGLGPDHPLGHAFMDEVGAQCGICTPGMILTAMSLGPNPSLERMRVGLSGNLCRCTGYEAIYRAIARASSNDASLARGGPPHNYDRTPHHSEHHQNVATSIISTQQRGSDSSGAGSAP
jgi:aerobic-type carbon monoxide dehydrogenase small subunit (CoxS/CutS family)